MGTNNEDYVEEHLIATNLAPDAEISFPLQPDPNGWGQIKFEAPPFYSIADQLHINLQTSMGQIVIGKSFDDLPLWSNKLFDEVVLIKNKSTNDVIFTTVRYSQTQTNVDSQVGTLAEQIPVTSPLLSTTLKKAAGGVAHVEFKSKRFLGTTRTHYCTGFLISESLLITNEHCLSDQEEVESSILKLDFVSENLTGFELERKPYWTKDYALDYTIVEINKDPRIDASRKLLLDPRPIVTARDAAVIHHYRGGEMKVSTDSQCIVHAEKVEGRVDHTDIEHGCDTDDSSSGSPVIDQKTGLVIALHHYGREPGAPPTELNQAIPIASIIESLLQKYCSDSKHSALEPLFEGSHTHCNNNT